MRGLPCRGAASRSRPTMPPRRSRSSGGKLAVVKSQIHAGGRGKGRFKEHPEQAGVVLVKSAAEAKAKRRAHAGQDACHQANGPGRQDGECGVGRRGSGDCPRALPGRGCRPGGGGPGRHHVFGRGDRDRRGGRPGSGKNPAGAGRRGVWALRLPGDEAGLQAGLPANADEKRAEVSAADGAVLPRQRLLDGRDQSARRDGGGRHAGPRRQGDVR